MFVEERVNGGEDRDVRRAADSLILCLAESTEVGAACRRSTSATRVWV